MPEKGKNRLFLILIGVISIGVLALTLSYESPDDRVERLGSSIKCPVCQGESIANSPADMATDMMDLVEARVAEGVSDDAIVNELLGSFSGAVLLDPPVSGPTLFLWLAPIAAAGIGIAVIWWWRRHPGVGSANGSETTVPMGVATRRRLFGGLILIGGFAVVVVVAGAFLQDRAGTTSGAADVGIDNLDDVSNETMEAVIAANLDNLQIDGMRLALAERYFTTGDYRSAFPHYLSVAESEQASPSEASTALIRLGWMAYDGNGEVEAATSLFDQALAITPESPIALYLKGQVLWCGAGNTDEATDLFEAVLQIADLPAETRSQVEQDLSRAVSGETCT